MLKSRLGGLFKTPLKTIPKRVLDLGCGTGIWARQFAAAYPSTQVFGVDFLPPNERFIDNDPPRNCTWIKASFEEEWTTFLPDAQEEPFDFIHARMLIAGVHDWPRLFQQCYNHLSPGGYLEVFEGLFELNAEDDGESNGPEQSPAIRWFALGQNYLDSNGLKWDRAMDLPAQLSSAGFNLVLDIPVKMKLYPDINDPEAERVRISSHYLSDMNSIVANMTDRVFGNESSALTLKEGRKLAAEAMRDMNVNSERRGYHTML